MSSIFCTSCGGNNPYANGKKPNFCAHCGTNLNSLAAFSQSNSSTTPKRSTARVQAAPIRFEHEEPEEEVYSDTPQLDRGDIEVSDMPKRRKVSLGDIMKTAVPGEDFSRQDMKTSAPRRSRDEIKAEYEREAGKGAQKTIEFD